MISETRLARSLTAEMHMDHKVHFTTVGIRIFYHIKMTVTKVLGVIRYFCFLGRDISNKNKLQVKFHLALKH